MSKVWLPSYFMKAHIISSFLTDLNGYLSSMWTSIEQSVMVSGIVDLFLGFAVHDWSSAVEFTNDGDPTGALTTIGCLINFLILLNIGWKVSICIKTTPVKSFLDQTTHSIAMIKNPNALYMSISGWGSEVLYENLEMKKAALTRDLIIQYAAHGCCHSICTGENSACITGLQKEINIHV